MKKAVPGGHVSAAGQAPLLQFPIAWAESAPGAFQALPGLVGVQRTQVTAERRGYSRPGDRAPVLRWRRQGDAQPMLEAGPGAQRRVRHPWPKRYIDN